MTMSDPSTITPTSIPAPGTPAYWTAQREAFALVRAHSFGDADPFVELDALRRIAAHGFAARVMAARGQPIADWISSLERITVDIAGGCNNDDSDPDVPPPGDDFCPRGCQPLFGMECGMCGYDGPGVRASDVTTVAEYCRHCRARTYQSRDGVCELCGKDAEDDETPCPPSDRDHDAQPPRAAPQGDAIDRVPAGPADADPACNPAPPALILV